MAGEIYIADKATLDLVKNDTTAIKQESAQILSTVKSSQSDPREYTPILLANKSSTFKVNTTTTIFSLEGEGYLSSFLYKDLRSKSFIIITIDNKVIYKCSGEQAARDGAYLGICQASQLYNKDSSDSKVYCLNRYLYDSFVDFPLTDQSTGPATICIDQKIYFKKNIKIEVEYTDQYGSDGKLSWTFLGGVKA